MAIYKIIAAINSMISNQHLITNAVRQEDDIFFLYDEQFKWSIAKAKDGNFYLRYYPGKELIDDLLSRHPEDWGDIASISYSTKELKTKEAIESFSELYQLLQNKVYSIDAVLDYIINTAV